MSESAAAAWAAALPHPFASTGRAPIRRTQPRPPVTPERRTAPCARTREVTGATTAPNGAVEYHDKASGRRLASSALTSIIAGTHATIVGTGVADGIAVAFRIEIDDLGEPGRNDTFAISWPGYSANGVLNGGNIQIHSS